MFKRLFNGWASNDDGALFRDGLRYELPEVSEFLLIAKPFKHVVEHHYISIFEDVTLVERVIVDDRDTFTELVRVDDLLSQICESLVELNAYELFSVRKEVSHPKYGSKA